VEDPSARASYDMKLSSAFIILTAVTFAACAAKKTPPPQTVANAEAPPAVETPDQGPRLSDDEITQQLFTAVNKQRTANGLPTLLASPELATSAQEHSDRMVAGNFLSTRGADEPSAITRITSHGVKTLKLGENVVRIKTRPDHVADETVAIWMGAAADQKNVLSNAFTKAGVGVSHAADGNYYISEDFAE
jgi:uncharacterized protein YkwD